MNCIKENNDDGNDLHLYKKSKIVIDKEMNMNKLMKYYITIWIPFMEKNKIDKIFEINDIQIKGIYNRFNWIITLLFYDKIIDIQVWKWGLIWKPKLNDTSENGIRELVDYYEGNYRKVYELLSLIKIELNKAKRVKK